MFRFFVQQPRRIVGLPFFVAYFDGEGLDFVGPITPISAIANVVFWFLVPQLILAFFGKRWQANIQSIISR